MIGKLSPELHEAIYAEEIAAYYLPKSKPQTQPYAVITGGQPGSGKSGITKHAIKRFKETGYVLVDADKLRPKHPEYMNLMKEADKLAANLTHADCGPWAARLMRDGVQGRRNLIIDQTSRDPDALAKITQGLKQAGYTVELHVMAVPAAVSELRIYTRYEGQRAKDGYGRFSTKDKHDEAYAGVANSVSAAEDGKLVDRLCIYDQKVQLIYENWLEGGQWQREARARKILDDERARPMTLQERQEYAKGFDDLAELLARPERQASAEEIQKIANLQRSAKAAVADAFDALRSEGDQHETNLSNAAWRQAAGEPPPPLDYGLAERRNDQPQQDEPRPGIPQGNRQASVLTAAATDENTVEAALANYIEEDRHNKGARIEDQVENLINIVADAEAVQSEQRAMLEGASIEQAYEATLKTYAEAMHNHVARLEARLNNLFKQQEARVQQTKENAPGMFSLPGKKRAWRAKSVREEAKLQTLHNCLEVVREIRKDTDPRAPRIKELATRRMRAKNPELASSWDAMRLERKKQEKAEKSLRAQQWAEDKIGLKEEQPGHSHGRGRGRSLSLRHPR